MVRWRSDALPTMRQLTETAHWAWIAQAHALQIESQVKMRLADEYDAAQERAGRIFWKGPPGRPKVVPDQNDFYHRLPPTSASLARISTTPVWFGTRSRPIGNAHDDLIVSGPRPIRTTC